jgi:hypothetical protein
MHELACGGASDAVPVVDACDVSRDIEPVPENLVPAGDEVVSEGLLANQ